MELPIVDLSGEEPVENGYGYTSAQIAQVAAAVIRARRVVGELNTDRSSDAIERARKGVEHELESALRVLGVPWEEMVRAAGEESSPHDPDPEQPQLWT